MSSSRSTKSLGKVLSAEEGPRPNPFKYIGVVGPTNTTLDVLLESGIDVNANIDGDLKLSEPGTGFTHVVWRATHKNFQQHPRPDLLPEVWSNM